MAGDRESLKPKQRHSLATATSSQRQRITKENKPSRSSLASAASPSFAQKTKSSNSRLSDVKLEESNISVYVRCRSRNEREVKENSGVVVSTLGHLGKEVVLQTGPMSVSNKTYTFDRVFGAESDQEMIYEGIAKSVLQEMLQGYNCTVFAYGQTGTGKTYTMSGDIKSPGNRLSEEAGIIPRTLSDLFKNLEENPDFSVKISFIELYNEELRDLIPINGNENEELRKVKIFEDPVKKSIVVQGMEEVYIKTAAEGMKLLADGSYKRQVAATQCNDLSSRSHSVFTITVHMKETDPISGEEYLKVGKLNLVDLAGSENINRSGAENKRAREAGMINQSLLTLGRVINALVDQSPHIPYRESKLTRLLQDSLGGRTKTCIIATISPAKVSLEETISTLEYANRAKSIKNKPQVNQTMSKKMLIKEYVQEIERLRTDLNATRNKNGVYLTEENLQNITDESESRRIQVEEQKLRINVLEEQIKKFKNDFEDYLTHVKNMEQDLFKSKEETQKLGEQLESTVIKLREAESEVKIERFLNSDHEDVETQLKEAHSSLISLLEQVEVVKEDLHLLLEHKQSLELKNSQQLKETKGEISTQTESIGKNVMNFHSESSNLATILNDNFTNMVETQKSKIKESCEFVSKSSKSIDGAIDKALHKIFQMNQSTDTELGKIDVLKNKIRSEIIKELDELRQESTVASQKLSKGLADVGCSVETGFGQIESFIKSTLSTVQSQMSNQSAEIISLKSSYLEHQAKYHGLLNQEVSKIVNLKEAERERSKLEKEDLFKKIQLLIEENEKTKLQRLDANVDHVVPKLESVGVKQTEFAKNFDLFITDKWVKNQKTFQEQLTGQSEYIGNQIGAVSKSIKKDHISPVNDSLDELVVNQKNSFDQTINNLGSNMENLSKYANELKDLNKENLQFTQSQLKSINKRTTESYDEIASNFTQFGKEILDSKPELVDSFISRQSEFLSDFKDSSISDLNSLKSSISKIRYIKDETPQPKRQKIEIRRDLPINQTRQQVISKYHNEIYSTMSSPQELSDQIGEPKAESPESESSQPVPIPDTQFKQPLSQSTKDLNIIKQVDPANEKRKSLNTRNSAALRPGSSLSMRSSSSTSHRSRN